MSRTQINCHLFYNYCIYSSLFSGVGNMLKLRMRFPTALVKFAFELKKNYTAVLWGYKQVVFKSTAHYRRLKCTYSVSYYTYNAVIDIQQQMSVYVSVFPPSELYYFEKRRKERNNITSIMFTRGMLQNCQTPSCIPESNHLISATPCDTQAQQCQPWHGS